MPASATDSVQIILYAWFTVFGITVGLVIALVCSHLVLDSLESERQVAEPTKSELETALMEVPHPIELPGGGWICCGDCYARILLRQVSLPGLRVLPYSVTSSSELEEPDSTHRVDGGGSPAESGRDSHKNGRRQSLWVEQGEPAGRVAPLYR